MVALLLGFFEHALHWGGASFAAGVAIVLPTIGFRDYWKTGRFWMALVALALVQIPVAYAMNPFVKGFPLTVTFGMVDCVLVVAAISYVCRNDENTT